MIPAHVLPAVRTCASSPGRRRTPPVELVRQAGYLAGSGPIRTRLRAAFWNTKYPSDVRAATVLGLSDGGEAPPPPILVDDFRQATASPESPLAAACATVLARVAPDELLAFPDSVEARDALWALGLTSGVLVYPDRIETPGNPFADVPPTVVVPAPGAGRGGRGVGGGVRRDGRLYPLVLPLPRRAGPGAGSGHLHHGPVRR
jgi:hypothetical protein